MQLVPIEYSNQRILTSKQLAEGYETTTAIISNNFNRNRDKYEEGKHFYGLRDRAKMEFLNHHQIDDGSKNVKVLYLWTEQGAYLHAKSLNTPVAWKIYTQLIDHYFKTANLPAPVPPSEPMVMPTETQMIRLLASNLLTLEQKLAAIELRSQEPVYNPQLERLINLLEQQYQPTQSQQKQISAADEEIYIPELTPEQRESEYRKQLQMKKLLTMFEAAAYIGVSRTTLQSIIDRTDFYPLTRIGHGRGRVFVNREKLDRWIDEQDDSLKTYRA